jgi:methylmalonyl-CoA decarboxylase subunit alpha
VSKSRDELEAKLRTLEEATLAGDAAQVERQHREGKLTARERVERLLDPGSFVEEFMLAETQVTDFGMAERRRPTDGVVSGYGTIDRRTVFVFAQDRTVLQGAVGQAHGEKIASVIDAASRVGAPVIGLYDSVGARIQEGLDVTRAIGRIFFANSSASGRVPQISAIMGPCIGVAAYSPALTDFIFMVRGTSQMFITGPSVIKEVTGEEVTMEELGGSKVHTEVSGCADEVSADDEACLQSIRKLVGLLPASCEESAPVQPNPLDDAHRPVPELEELVPDDARKPYNMVDVIKRLVDGGDFFELKARFARNMVVGFGRLDGRTVGFVGNQPRWMAGAIDVDAADKAARFVRFCDAFNIPIVTLVDVPGFMPGVAQERAGIIRHGAKMLFAYSEATVPKITVYLRKGYGGAKQAMSTRELGADQVFVWPGVELAVMGADAAVDVLYRREIEAAPDPVAARQQRVAELTERFSGPFDALSKQFAHAAIRPAETRIRLIQALHMLQGKQEQRPPKKHSLIPL